MHRHQDFFKKDLAHDFTKGSPESACVFMDKKTEGKERNRRKQYDHITLFNFEFICLHRKLFSRLNFRNSIQDCLSIFAAYRT